MSENQMQSKPDTAEQRATKGGLAQRLVRRLLVRLEGSDYKERFERLAKQHALSNSPCSPTMAEMAEALGKAVLWGECASWHILYRENIDWRYLDEARETLTAHSLHNDRPLATGERAADRNQETL